MYLRWYEIGIGYRRPNKRFFDRLVRPTAFCNHSFRTVISTTRRCIASAVANGLVVMLGAYNNKQQVHGLPFVIQRACKMTHERERRFLVSPPGGLSPPGLASQDAKSCWSYIQTIGSPFVGFVGGLVRERWTSTNSTSRPLSRS